ncbi:MAG: hypothetical protein ACREL7_17490 [Longimicrobiales bacterium]
MNCRFEIRPAPWLVRPLRIGIRVWVGEWFPVRVPGEALRSRLTDMDDRFGGDSETAIDSRMSAALRAAGSFDAPTPNHRLLAQQASSALDAGIADLNALIEGDIARFRATVASAGIEVMPVIRRVSQ